MYLIQEGLQRAWDNQQGWLQDFYKGGSNCSSDNSTSNSTSAAQEAKKCTREMCSCAESDDISSYSNGDTDNSSPAFDRNNNGDPFVDGDFVFQVLKSATPKDLKTALSNSARDCTGVGSGACKNELAAGVGDDRMPFASSSSGACTLTDELQSVADSAAEQLVKELAYSSKLCYLAMLHHKGALSHVHSLNCATMKECDAPPASYWENVACRMEFSQPQLLQFRIALEEHMRGIQQIAASMGIHCLEVDDSATARAEDGVGWSSLQQHHGACVGTADTLAAVWQTGMAANAVSTACSSMTTASAVVSAVLAKVAGQVAEESGYHAMVSSMSGGGAAAAEVNGCDSGLSLDFLEKATAGLGKIDQLSLRTIVYFINSLSPYQHRQMVVASYPYYPALHHIMETAVQNNICSTAAGAEASSLPAQEVSAHMQRRQAMVDSHPDLQWWRDMFA
eukprot:gene1205-1542_t